MCCMISPLNVFRSYRRKGNPHHVLFRSKREQNCAAATNAPKLHNTVV
jgi:hypothetical protein